MSGAWSSAAILNISHKPLAACLPADVCLSPASRRPWLPCSQVADALMNGVLRGMMLEVAIDAMLETKWRTSLLDRVINMRELKEDKKPRKRPISGRERKEREKRARKEAEKKAKADALAAAVLGETSTSFLSPTTDLPAGGEAPSDPPVSGPSPPFPDSSPAGEPSEGPPAAEPPPGGEPTDGIRTEDMVTPLDPPSAWPEPAPVQGPRPATLGLDLPPGIDEVVALDSPQGPGPGPGPGPTVVEPLWPSKSEPPGLQAAINLVVTSAPSAAGAVRSPAGRRASMEAWGLPAPAPPKTPSRRGSAIVSPSRRGSAVTPSRRSSAATKEEEPPPPEPTEEEMIIQRISSAPRYSQVSRCGLLARNSGRVTPTARHVLHQRDSKGLQSFLARAVCLLGISDVSFSS
jgi:hypothetical protein